jgi:hypothetical protein
VLFPHGHAAEQERVGHIQFLEPGEKLNEEAMYAIYERDETKFEGYEEDKEDLADLGEAVELFRQLRDDPEEFERIASLRDGIRTGKHSNEKGLYVFCQAGGYRQLYMLDREGEVISRDFCCVLKAISCEEAEPPFPLPPGYNAAVMCVKERFEREVKERRAERENRRSLTSRTTLRPPRATGAVHGNRGRGTAGEDRHAGAALRRSARQRRGAPS